MKRVVFLNTQATSLGTFKTGEEIDLPDDVAELWILRKICRLPFEEPSNHVEKETLRYTNQPYQVNKRKRKRKIKK